MQRVGIANIANRRLDSLSGGQQQRALLAKTLMSPAKIYLLDEPCAALDPPAKEDFLKIVRQLADAGLSLLVSSHDWGESLNNYDQVIVLDKTVLAVGSPDSIKDKLNDINVSAINENNSLNQKMFLLNFELDNSFGKVRNIRVYETKVETFWDFFQEYGYL